MVKLYTDGSYKVDPERCAFGIYAEDTTGDEKKIFTLSGYTTEKKYLKSCNISAECIGSILGTLMLATKGYKNFIICHDYTGIEQFLSGGYKPRTEVSKEYVKAMRSLASTFELTIGFEYVKGHSNVFGNEQADSLAYNAVDDRTKEIRAVIDRL